jgi:DnaK suppressor protein
MTLDTQKLKKQLEEEKELLLKELGSVGKQNPSNPDDWEAKEDENVERADPSLKADVIEEIEERHALTDTLEARLKNVKQALENLEGGTFGLCSECQKQIEEDRIEANAAAPTCKEHMG